MNMAAANLTPGRAGVHPARGLSKRAVAQSAKPPKPRSPAGGEFGRAGSAGSAGSVG
jgi:hypothetical protein